MPLLSNINCLKLKRGKWVGKNERVRDTDEIFQQGFYRENIKNSVQQERENLGILF